MPSDEAAAEQTLEVMLWMALDMQPMYFSFRIYVNNKTLKNFILICS